jgi:signal transduction histidine kinase
MIADIQLAGKLKISFTHDIRDELLSSGKKITLFRILQEQLKNIIKHSRATITQIFLQDKEDHVTLMIKDNGIRFNAQKTRQEIGLSNIEERAAFYNGTIDIETSPGKGCILTVTIPVKE